MLRPFIIQLTQGQTLSDGDVAAAIGQLTDEQVPVELKAEFLTALAGKGEAPAEIAAFARELRERAVPVPLAPSASNPAL